MQMKALDMAKNVGPIPRGFTAITPYLRIKGALAAIAFYETVFDATTLRLLKMGDRVGHAELAFSGARIALSDEFPEMGIVGPVTMKGTTITIMHYVTDVDAVVVKAVAHGAKLLRPAVDEFYGDRTAQIEDPFGHVWMIQTHQEDVSDAEMQKRLDAMMQHSPKSL